ncbi:MAG: phosphatidic acid phosphatase [Oscillospiraceae bacterium]|nr:phosphatidic acid phosphatase [Oscillospiraceae bacterium]
MKKPVVDYRQFRFSKLNDPQFSHLKLLLGWVGYFVLYYLTENFIPVENCHPVWCPLDDLIPFSEYFLIFYVSWYALIVISLGYFLLYNIDNFKGLQTFIIVTQVVAMIVYIVYPTRQDLRPAEFANDNFLTSLMAFIYSFDTNTGVCPSLHVAYSIGIASAWLKEKSANIPWKVFVVVLVILISLSTAFVKQHSIVDAFAAIPVCILAEIIAYGKPYWKNKLKKQNS